MGGAAPRGARGAGGRRVGATVLRRERLISPRASLEPNRTPDAAGERFRAGSLPRLEASFAEGLTAAVTGRELDFGRHTATPAREVAAAYGALHEWAAGRFELVIGGSQVHGARLFQADDVRVPEPEGRSGPAAVRVAGYDGFLVSRPGVLLTAGVADCVPAFLAAPERTVVALLHAGWRGVAAGIVPLAIETMQREYGVTPGEIRAWWGPAIGPCCYPVGPEVVDALAATPAGARRESWLAVDGEDIARVDLRAALTLQAVASGVPTASIASSPLCTACDERLHSYRRGRGGGGRMLALAGYAG